MSRGATTATERLLVVVIPVRGTRASAFHRGGLKRRDILRALLANFCHSQLPAALFAEKIPGELFIKPLDAVPV